MGERWICADPNYWVPGVTEADPRRLRSGRNDNVFANNTTIAKCFTRVNSGITVLRTAVAVGPTRTECCNYTGRQGMWVIDGLDGWTWLSENRKLVWSLLCQIFEAKTINEHQTNFQQQCQHQKPISLKVCIFYKFLSQLNTQDSKFICITNITYT